MLACMAWRKGMGAEMAKRAKAAAGGHEAWHRMLTNHLKEGLIAEQILGVVIAQEGMLRPADVEQLWLDARVAAGLYVP
jgi:hypothetical protein